MTTRPVGYAGVWRPSGAVALAVGLALLAAAAGPTWADAEFPKLRPYHKAVDRSVDRALLFLAASQLEDGSFTDWEGQTNGVVGLVGMAFLSKGYRPGAPPYGDVINRTIDYILSTPDKNGWLGARGGHIYSHGIATLYLSQVSGMVDPGRQQRIDIVLPRALRVILDAQKVPKTLPEDSGGWRYNPHSTDSDISVTAWCLMALRSARLNGAPIPDTAIRDAMGFIDRCRNPDGGYRYYAIGSRPDTSHPTRTAVALLCRELCGHHADDVNRQAADSLIKAMDPVDVYAKQDLHEYMTYYAAQALFQMGGEHWEQFAPAMYQHLLSKQRSDGAFVIREVRGAVYQTAMFTLALTVSYRQLPIYQR